MHLCRITCDSHSAQCPCLHCRQTSADRDIEARLLAANFVSFNGDTPTHTSGTIVDMFLGDPERPLAVQVCPECVGGSDHQLVYAKAPVRATLEYGAGLGRVRWAGQECSGRLGSVASQVH